jgi:hypothetical protein
MASLDSGLRRNDGNARVEFELAAPKS